MRLGILAKDLRGGGAARAMVKLANGLAARHDVDLLLVQATGPYLGEVSPDVNVVDLGARRTITAIAPLVGYLRRRRPDAILSALRHVNVMAIISRALSRIRCCLVVSERNMIALSARSTPRRRDRLFFVLIPLLYRLADAAVAIAADIRDELATTFGVPEEKLHLIYNPIVSDEMMENASAPVDEPWFTSDLPTVLAVGRLTEHKNYDLLLRSFAKAHDEVRCRLLILGDGPERERLMRLARGLGVVHQVEMPGFVTNVYKFMRQSDLFVHTSRWEGLPGALIEALACGMPIVAIDSPGGVSEVLGGGRYGRLVEPEDEAGLAAAIVDGIRGEITPPDPASWARFEQGAVVEQYESLLRTCVQAGLGRR